MTPNFNVYSQYYDILYKDKNYAEEADYINRHVKQWLPDAVKLLELGCGTGNHASHLCRLGYEVTGIERSAEMVEQARKKHISGFHPIVDDITAFSLNNQFDAAISLFHSMCYVTTNAGLLASFNRISKHLKQGGLFIFDLWYGPAVLNDLPSTRIKRIRNEHLEITRLAETEMLFEKNIAEVNYEIIAKDRQTGQYSTLTERHPMRYFSIPEIELLAECTGFKCLLTEEFLSSRKPAIDSWNILMVLQKNS